MDRIRQSFQSASQENRTCFIPYLCAGDPDYATSLALCKIAVEAQVDCLEIGVPFTDPLADGTTNQLAAQRALESGMTSTKVFDLVREIRTFTQTPIIFYTYYNLVLAPGLNNYAQRCKEAGVDGLLTLDCPPEEADDLLSACKEHDLKTVFIVTPSTPVERITKIAQAATGFIYYVSRAGVTGARSKMADDLPERVAAIRQHTDLPVVVGFGISKADHVRQISAIADGVVVGSALVQTIADDPSDPKGILERFQSKLASMRA